MSEKDSVEKNEDVVKDFAKNTKTTKKPTAKNTRSKAAKKDPVKKTSVKAENIVEAKEEVQEEDSFSFDDMFITEEDTFDIEVRFYKENDNLMVEGVHDDFDTTKKANSFTVTFKYPSYADQEAIRNSVDVRNIQDMTLGEYIQLENNRAFILIRKWSLNKSTSQISLLDPVIIKGICHKLRGKLGQKGII